MSQEKNKKANKDQLLSLKEDNFGKKNIDCQGTSNTQCLGNTMNLRDDTYTFNDHNEQASKLDQDNNSKLTNKDNNLKSKKKQIKDKDKDLDTDTAGNSRWNSWTRDEKVCFYEIIAHASSQPLCLQKLFKVMNEVSIIYHFKYHITYFS